VGGGASSHSQSLLQAASRRAPQEGDLAVASLLPPHPMASAEELQQNPSPVPAEVAAAAANGDEVAGSGTGRLAQLLQAGVEAEASRAAALAPVAASSSARLSASRVSTSPLSGEGGGCEDPPGGGPPSQRVGSRREEVQPAGSRRGGAPPALSAVVWCRREEKAVSRGLVEELRKVATRSR
jgi:hypothetical protein